MNALFGELKAGIEGIVGRTIDPKENLFSDAIDSLMLVELINLVEDLAAKHGLELNMSALIAEDELSLEDISRAFGNQA